MEELIVNSPTPPEKLAGFPVGKFFYIDNQFGSYDVFVYLYIVTSTIEEGIEWIIRSYSLCDCTLKCNGGNF